ncbi:unnamed protein product [Cyclocybe aegerita]|uniref:F-box domain-containing protein n=1 Tax=Cyclocybe aegerita TaxID=1973307 RepID=A0A8S0VYC1_CYCAE|nr:unnamed protein product [Cyclocybe aegerita]
MKHPNNAADRFTRHFGTNYAPTETEVEELKNILRDPDTQLRALDEQIVQKELDGLRKRRIALLESTRNHRTLLSLIRRIPQELLQDIFLACLPEDRNPSMSTDEAPMLLTRVSSYWRQVALTTPQLWAKIYILIPSVADQWGHQEEMSRESIHDAVNQRIKGVGSAEHGKFREQSLDSEWNIGQPAASLKIFSGSIPLESVKWERMITLSFECGHRSTWSGLDFSSITFTKAALRQASVLKNFTLRSRSLNQDVREDEDSPPIELPFLTHLDIEDEGCSILPLLRTPSLRSCSYRDRSGNARHTSPLLQFLNLNPGINVEQLYTDNTSVPHEQLIECLRLCPVLQLLQLGFHNPVWPVHTTYRRIGRLDDNFLRLFVTTAHSTLSNKADILCPLLEDIKFIQETNLSEVAVIKFIEQKQRREDQRLNKLRNIKVTFGRKRREGEDMMSAIAPYIDEGLKAQFTYRHAAYRSQTKYALYTLDEYNYLIFSDNEMVNKMPNLTGGRHVPISSSPSRWTALQYRLGNSHKVLAAMIWA